MYDMYPEWGPSKNRALATTLGTSPVTPAAGVGASHTSWPFDARDDDAQRPDDN